MIHDFTSFVVLGELGSNFCIQLDISNEDKNPPLSLRNCSFEDVDTKLVEHGIKTEVRAYWIDYLIYDVRKEHINSQKNIPFPTQPSKVPLLRRRKRQSLDSIPILGDFLADPLKFLGVEYPSDLIVASPLASQVWISVNTSRIVNPGGEFDCSVEKSVDFSVEIYCTKKLNL